MTPQPAKPRVLIVDDHPVNRMVFESLLESEYTVAVAENGPEALGLAHREEYAVILLDIRMPGMDGFEVAEILRKRERTRHTPIIFMSAYDQTIVQAKRGYIVGATDFLFSPVDSELLKLKVATYVQIYLRTESLRLQVQLLQDTVRALETVISHRSPVDEPVQEGIRHIEDQVDDLERHLGPLQG
ncbi:MAG TPA: response regulator [Planctomycetota bacterium]|nr:response regulator [Planctomycetota bacterium]